MMRDEKKVQRAWSLSERNPIARIEPRIVPNNMTPKLDYYSQGKDRLASTYDAKCQQKN